MDLFDKKGIRPMLISELKKAFDSPDYIFELKLDGIRCIAYLDPENNSSELINKRDFKLLPRFPELNEIHKQVKKKCILDGELIVSKNGVPDFFDIQRRSMMSDPFKIRLAYKQHPASFVAYDIIYIDGELTTDLDLIKRKKILEKTVKENDRIAISRYIENNGVKLFELAKQQKLEGIVAKLKGSKYLFDKRSKDWIKIKFLEDMDFVVCGYILKENNMASLVIAQYGNDGKLAYKGHVTLGVSLSKLEQYNYKIASSPTIPHVPEGNENAVWLEPTLVATVEYMPNDKGALRQPVLKGIREDKLPIECREEQ
ncbi:RNA ligase family protein [Metaclostridioides mangenotii]|uniref:ATP-dependent DNA ligase n=1 Tax=Metaclostridioides mangenotii TaxID=1540 RepID=UPI0026F0999B|nr:RNA ligase family protein [Clostridioides mangenotii]